jgi:hypothetical protein
MLLTGGSLVLRADQTFDAVTCYAYRAPECWTQYVATGTYAVAGDRVVLTTAFGSSELTRRRDGSLVAPPDVDGRVLVYVKQ